MTITRRRGAARPPLHLARRVSLLAAIAVAARSAAAQPAVVQPAVAQPAVATPATPIAAAGSPLDG
jgi:hypothetical protein